MKQLALDLFTTIGGLVSLFSVCTGILHLFNLWMWKRKFNWDNALRTGRKLLENIESTNWKPEIVIGLGRSGGIWGGWIAGNLGSLPFYVIDNIYEIKNELSVKFPDGEAILQALKKTYPDKKNILIVEGASSTGLTPSEFKKNFATQLKDYDCKFAVLYLNPSSNMDIDFVGQIGPSNWPTKFPWHERKSYRPFLRDIFFKNNKN